MVFLTLLWMTPRRNSAIQTRAFGTPDMRTRWKHGVGMMRDQCGDRACACKGFLADPLGANDAAEKQRGNRNFGMCYRCLRKKLPSPIFSPRASLGLHDGATNAEKHGESEFTAQNAPKPFKKLVLL